MMSDLLTELDTDNAFFYNTLLSKKAQPKITPKNYLWHL